MKRWSRASSCGALLLVAAVCATASPVTASAQAPSLTAAPRNELSIVAPAGAVVPSSTSASPIVEATGTRVSWSASGSGVQLSTHDSEPFKVGTFQVGDAAGRLKVSASSNGNICSDSANARVTVHEVTYTDDKVTSLAATAQTNCSGAGQTVTELRFNSGVGAQRAWGLPLGKSAAPRKLTFTTPEATTVKDIAWAGDLTGQLKNNTCANASLPAGGTCTVDLVTRPLEVGAEFVALSIRDAEAKRLDTISVVALGTATPDGAYTPLAQPRRFADTRSNNRPLTGGTFRDFQIGGVNGLPSTGISSVVLNITVVSPTANGYLTAYPSGTARPTASSLNFNKGWTGANLVTVRAGTGGFNGKVRLLASAGYTHVLVDVVGYYRNAAGTSSTPGAYGSFHAFEPYRLYDSRRSSKVGGYEIFDLSTDFGAVNPRIKALAINVTAVAPEGSGYLTVWNGINSVNVPVVSTLNFTAGRVVPNMTIVPAGRLNNLPAFTVANGSSKKVHVVVDVVGVFDDDLIPDGSRLAPLPTPKRILDTRTRLGFGTLGPLATGTASASAVGGAWTTSLSSNLTAVAPSQGTVLTIWAAGDPRPNVSAMNPAAGQLVASMVMPGLSDTQQYSVFNGGNGTTNVLHDVVGTFEYFRTSEFAPDNGVLTGAATLVGGSPSQTVASKDTTARKAPTNAEDLAPRRVASSKLNVR